VQSESTRPASPWGESRRFRDPINGFLHLTGFFFAVLGTAFLLWRAQQRDVSHVWGTAVYGVGLCSCFLASSLHHLVRGTRALEMWLLKVDHAAIYVFIAGSYTPICLWMLPPPGSLWLLAVVWAIAFVGVVYKLRFAPDQAHVDDPPPLFDTLLYVAMGWLAITEVGNLFARAVPGTLSLLVLGGLAYSIGGLILARRWLDFWPSRFGHHEIWHLCVIAGSVFIYGFLFVNLY
jgi:hemolysin III